MLKYTLIAIALVALAGFAAIRVFPVNVARFHVDPETTDLPKIRGYVLVRRGADIEPQVFDLPPNELAQMVERLILATPRTVKLAGNINTGHASYVTRSGFWGFPDIASVKITQNEGGTSSILILSRQIYGLEDFGVNKARVENWLGQF